MSKFHTDNTQPAKKIRILIADDHAVVRSGLQSLLKLAREFVVVGEANNGTDAVKMADELKPDVVLLDISMPIMSGIEATRVIKQKSSGTKVLILTIHASEDFVQEVIQAGADGYVLKHADKEEIFDAIRSVAASEPYFSPDVSKLLIERVMKSAHEPSNHSSRSGDNLTKREQEILCLIAEGFTNREIADKLFLSPSTINTHRTNLMRKLDIHDTAGLVRFAIGEGYVKTAVTT